jgi:hypothetical protein
MLAILHGIDYTPLWFRIDLVTNLLVRDFGFCWGKSETTKQNR